MFNHTYESIVLIYEPCSMKTSRVRCAAVSSLRFLAGNFRHVCFQTLNTVMSATDLCMYCSHYVLFCACFVMHVLRLPLITDRQRPEPRRMASHPVTVQDLSQERDGQLCPEHDAVGFSTPIPFNGALMIRVTL